MIDNKISLLLTCGVPVLLIVGSILWHMGHPRLPSLGKYLMPRLFIAVGWFAIAFIISTSSSSNKHYELAQQACNAGDYKKAIHEFSFLVNPAVSGSTKYRSYMEECLLPIADTKAQSGDYQTALSLYLELYDSYNKSIPALTAERIISLLEATEQSELINLDTCNKLDILLEQDLIPGRDINAPQFYSNCGQIYEEEQDYANALSMYDDFLRNYPHHQLANSIQTAVAENEADLAIATSNAITTIAQTKVADAKKIRTGNLSEPESSGFAPFNTAVVIIRNDSDYQLEIVFSGELGYVEELQGCDTCDAYPTGKGPASFNPDLPCRGEALLGRYTLSPGQYDVLIKATKENDSASYLGKWNLEGGSEYYQCFYFEIVR